MEAAKDHNNGYGGSSEESAQGRRGDDDIIDGDDQNSVNNNNNNNNDDNTVYVYELYSPLRYLHQLMKALLRCLCCFICPGSSTSRPVPREEYYRSDCTTWRGQLGPRRRPIRPPISTGDGGQVN